MTRADHPSPVPQPPGAQHPGTSGVAIGSEAPLPPDHEMHAGGPAASTLRPVKPPKKRPCFHCGTMTSNKVLEKTGDLCWRCYRPVGYNILKMLLSITAVLIVAAVSIVGWQMYDRGEGFFSAKEPAGTEEPQQRNFTPEQRMTIIRRMVLDGVPLKDLCAEYEIEPATLRGWLRQLLDTGATAFEPRVREPLPLDKRITSLEQKLQLASKAMAELREGLTQLRRETGQYEANPSQQFILEPGGPPPR